MLAAPTSWKKAENRRAMEIISAQGVRNLTFSTLNQASQIVLRSIPVRSRNRLIIE
jgi:hypothetical protein